MCDLVFNEMDADGSGAIAYSEYMLQLLKDALARDRQRILDLFRQWDTDRSGAVSKQEFTNGIRRAGFDAKQKDLDLIFDDLDQDRSGELEYSELQSQLHKYAEAGWANRTSVAAGYYDL